MLAKRDKAAFSRFVLSVKINELIFLIDIKNLSHCRKHNMFGGSVYAPWKLLATFCYPNPIVYLCSAGIFTCCQPAFELFGV
ncbi:hypothetical protein A3Q29_17265 [Providencia stuartii]|uniref:Uncharacterized protein n=1 Tax=Providencia stuartii TaxID=588 RepID=A0A1S1HQE7_PROST|nr:hypothetical protein A3Q29_17265 [Providencia stuartii]